MKVSFTPLLSWGFSIFIFLPTIPRANELKTGGTPAEKALLYYFLKQPLFLSITNMTVYMYASGVKFEPIRSVPCSI